MISIVIVTCNRKLELETAVLSCLGRSREPFEIILIDNNSTDGTSTYIGELAEKMDFDLHLIRNNENVGHVISRNRAFEMAKGDIVYFLDDDAYIHTKDNCLSDVAGFMRGNPHFPVVATEIYNVTKKKYQHGGFPIKAGERADGEVFNFIGASHFINKNIVQKDKLYPEEVFYGGEEQYLSFYLRKMDYGIYYYKEMVVYHAPSESTRMSPDDILVQNYSNFFNVKRYFTPFVFLPVIWIVMMIRVLLQSFKKPYLFKRFLFQINHTYYRKYRTPMTFIQFAGLIRIYGKRNIL